MIFADIFDKKIIKNEKQPFISHIIYGIIYLAEDKEVVYSLHRLWEGPFL